jgi:hypothetical protein
MLNRISDVEIYIIIRIPGRLGHRKIIGRFSGEKFTKMNPVVSGSYFFTKDSNLKKALG